MCVPCSRAVVALIECSWRPQQHAHGLPARAHRADEERRGVDGERRMCSCSRRCRWWCSRHRCDAVAGVAWHAGHRVRQPTVRDGRGVRRGVAATLLPCGLRHTGRQYVERPHAFIHFCMLGCAYTPSRSCYVHYVRSITFTTLRRTVQSVRGPPTDACATATARAIRRLMAPRSAPALTYVLVAV